MAPSFTRRIAVLVLVLSASMGGSAVGCSLGLDKSLINQSTGDDGEAPVEAGGDGAVKPPTDAPLSDVVVPPEADAGSCATDKDCQNAVGDAGSCVKSATCDPTWHVCILDTCDVGACKAAICNEALQTCSVPTSYGFSATKFNVPYGGVGAAVRNSIAAVWPFVFVVTTNGVAAYNVIDPTDSTPPQVAVHGVPFLPIATVAVGRRVYFSTDTQGGGPTYRQALAWIDVPQNPFVTSFVATSAWVGTSQQNVQAVLTNGVDGLFFVYGTGSLYPTADMHPPVDDSTTLLSYSNAGLATGAGIVAASGSRLVTYQYEGSTNATNFQLVNGAGTSSATATTPPTVLPSWPVASQSVFGTGGDGSLLWTDGVFELDDAGSVTGVASSRLTWLLDSGTAANFDTSVYLDLETYSPVTGDNVAGPPLWIDANTALGLAAASTSSTNSTSVQVVTKQPASVDSTRRTLLSVPPGAVGVAASGGFGYVLAQDDPNNKTCSVSIFAPSCGASDM
jgi:hypothetical protein